MTNLDDLKLELSVNKKINRMELVKARAQLRTKRRIAEQIEKQEMKALEEQVAKQNIAEAKAGVTVTAVIDESAPVDASKKKGK